MKICTVCKKEKSITEFYNCTKCKDGKSYRCKECDSKARRKYYEENETSLDKRLARGRRRKYKKYGITEEKYNDMLLEQDNKCAICGGTDTRSTSHELSIDHCHTSGIIRGLLCNNCNRALGLLGDTASNVYKAYKYLLRFENQLKEYK